MRLMAKILTSVESANRAIKDGSLGKIVQRGVQ